MSETAVERRTGERVAEGDGKRLDLANRKRALMRQLAEWLDWDAATTTRIYSAHVARGDRDW
jgi:hypothetical protein